MTTTIKKIFACLLGFALVTSASPIAASGFMDGLKDPTDGKYDFSGMVLGKGGGFLPIPIIVTEPALGGFGLGATLAYFHGKKTAETVDPWTLKMKDLKPPSISLAAGFYTVNNSGVVVVGHLGKWRDDSIRYTGILGGADINLDFYVRDRSTEINLVGIFLLQEVLFRIRSSNVFVGGGYTFTELEPTFLTSLATQLPLPEINPDHRDRNAGVNVKSQFDSRDNSFTPDRGFLASLEGTVFNTVLGGKHDYEQVQADFQGFFPIAPVVLGVRADVNWTASGAPFYAVPFISMRGIPAMRYQGPTVATVQLEARWDIVQRWSLVGFGGIGSTYGGEKGEDYKGKAAGGLGFRYLMGRVLGMRGGIDIAVGPDGWAYYLTVGSAWAF